jgi:hypothetical protein
MANQSAIVTLKDGSQIIVNDVADLQNYSDREDIESISFFGDANTVIDAGIVLDAGIDIIDAGIVNTQAAVLIESKPVVKEIPPATLADALPVVTGAIAGAISSVGMPALTNFAKSLLNNKLKLNKKDSKSEEKEEPTDCKTHQIKAASKFASLSARITALENSLGSGDKAANISSISDDFEELQEKVEKLEKALKNKKGKK